MSCSEEESNVASVLSQMSQIKQSPLDGEEPHGMNVAHQCDVETTTTNSQQEIVNVDNYEDACSNELDQKIDTTTLELSDEHQNTTLHSTLEVSSVKVFQCEYCGKVFSKSYNLKTHHRVHTGERPFPCPICTHGFANLGDLKRHARTHTGEKPFICEFCNKAFSDFGSHKRHLRLHTGFKPFKCEQCDREFTRLDSYKNHTRLHTGERPYKCDECQKEFNYLTTYKRHLNIHSGERPYSCDICGKKFTRLNYLKNHTSCHNKLTLTGAKDNHETNNPETITTLDVSEIAQKDVHHTQVEDDDVIQQVAHALSQGGVQLSTVVDTSGQSILIQTPTLSTEARSVILDQNIMDHSSKVNFTVESDDKDNIFIKEEHEQTTQLYITQQLFKASEHPEMITEAHLDNSKYQCINTGVDELNEQNMQSDDVQSKRSIAHDISQESDVSLVTNINDNAVYIAIDPTQTNVQEVLGELHVAVVPES